MNKVKKIIIVEKYQHPENNGIWERRECWKKTLEHYKDFPEVESILYQELEEYSKDNKVIPDFVKGDCIEAAIKLVEEGMNPLLLNMSDWRYPGGEVEAGVATQEEELFRRSNYHKHLLRKYYPMKKFQTVVSKGVEFWLGAAYKGFPELEKKVFIDCVAAPALVGPHTTADKLDDDSIKNNDYLFQKDKDIMEKKIRMLFYAASQNGNDSLVLSAWGCGAFHCPIYGTAQLFKKVIEEGVPSSVKKIVFAITGNRFELFEDSYTAECLT